MVAGMSLQGARDAAAWAAEEGNYEELVHELHRIHSAFPSEALSTSVALPLVDAAKGRLKARRGMKERFWPALLRMAVMDYPCLASVARPSHDAGLDSQRGTALMQLLFRRVTGRRPAVRSWRLA